MAVSDQEFIKLFPLMSARALGEQIGITERNVFRRRRRIEKDYGISLDSMATLQQRDPAANVRRKLNLKNGSIIVGGDWHIWKEWTTAQLAFIDVTEKLKPAVTVLNGDVIDGAAISRHPPINWESVPTIEEELRYVTERLDAVEKAHPKSKRYWLLGNHCARFESRLAKEAPEFRGVKGVHLKDHFPRWIHGMSLWINDDIVIKHRFKGGFHAAHNNTVTAGKTIVTNHTHQQRVSPWTDYNGTRWGVETGCMAEPLGPQFIYGEDNPKNHISGFAVLTVKDGVLMHPEFVRVIDEYVYEFRGERHKVSL